MFRRCLLFTLLISLDIFALAQKIQMLDSGQKSSLRGLSAVSDQVIWVSGSGGTVGLSTDAGNNWKWMHVPGFEKSDFRDVEAFSDLEAVIMGITEPAVILRTTDGGNTWTTVFKDTAKSAFLDAMDFSGDQGVVIGDPEEGKILFFHTHDRGKRWEMLSSPGLDTTAAGEAFFAASGSNIRLLTTEQWVLVSGGKKSCLYTGDKRFPLLLNQGRETTGANSIAINPANPNQAFVVGGDFSQDTLQKGNSLLLQLNPFHQQLPRIPPRGYRSCVEYLNEQKMICCGTSGVDISIDGGLNWKGISDRSFHVCRKSKTGKAVFLAGSRGVVARLGWD
jgi:photosystem II stability/assembly factor-like uncharacterized protein